MPTEFISLTFPNASTEINPLPGAGIDPDYLSRYARSLDDYEFNYTLVPYDSSYFDPFTVGATIAAVTKKLKVIIALRPNTLYPTVAAKALATLDQLSRGRAVVHFIAGGSDAEQAKEGDFLKKEERYARLEEYIRILRRAWESADPFDWDGKYYQFKQFSNRVRPVNGTIPVSVGGSSDEAYRIGGSLADIFGLWGEPLKETKEQIDRIYAEAERAGRAPNDRPRIWVTFRPIVAETDDLAWEKAYRTLDALKRNRASSAPANGAAPPPPQNVGSQRLLEIAARGEVQDRALWYPTVTATNARGASTALVGSPQTIADSILDYVDLGAELISIRGYDNLNDAIDYGRYVLPRVRDALKQRENEPKQAESGEKPVDEGQKLAVTEEKPAEIGEKTVDTEEKLAETGGTLVENEQQKLVETEEKPAQNEENLAEAEEGPVQNEKKLAEAKEGPVQNEEKPAETEENPVQNGHKLAETGEQPAQNEEKPVNTVQKLAETEEKPVEIEKTPAENGQKQAE